MQYVSDAFMSALGDTVEPVFTADVYYGGQLLKQGLPISGGEVVIDSSQTVRGTCSLVVNDPDGTLAPKSRTDPLAPYGQEINIRAGLQVSGVPETVSLGWFRIQQSTPSESWRWLRDGVTSVASGASIPVTGRDRGSLLVDFPFISPEQQVKTTVWAEIVRITQGLLPVVNAGLDASIPANSVVYPTDRWAAIVMLAKLVSAHPVITPNGALTLKLDVPGSQVWAVDAGPEGTIGQFQPTLSRTDLRNAVRVQGKDDSGNPITVIATQPDGPLKWGGPFGCVPADTIVDPLLNTLTAVTARAQAELTKAIAGTSQLVEMPTVLNYALEVEDMVSVSLPSRSGVVPVQRLVMPMRGTMTTTVAVPAEWLLNG